MKRAMADEGATEKGEDRKMKKIRVEGEEEEGEKEEGGRGRGFVNLDANLLCEVLKHVDARTLAAAGCVSKLWHRTAQEGGRGRGFVNLDEKLLYEVLKHVDARTLAAAGCVSKLWHRTAQDERLWELICTRHWANIGCPKQQLRSVVLALGGFRRLHSQFLCHLSKPQSSGSSSSSSASSSSWAPFAPMIGSKPPTRWGKDEDHLSRSLLSIR